MSKFMYVAHVDNYVKRSVPGVPGAWAHLFYSRGADFPEDVPSGCNTRFTNIDQRAYRDVAESYRNKADLTFHLKNNGITVLATSVQVRTVGNTVILTAEIPDELGTVNGAHTTQIIQKHKNENPEQLAHITLIEGYPAQLIQPVAAGLNTGIQATGASIADHAGLFSEVREALSAEPYADWIGYRDNQTGVSATSKLLLSLMWCCNPLLFGPDSQKHPGWVYNMAPRVYEKFYNTKKYSSDSDKEYRETMLKMVKVLPDIIELYCYINETAVNYLKKARKSRTQHADGHGEKINEVNVGDLCVTATGLPFRDPADETKYRQLRESYRLIIVSGLRGLLCVRDGALSWDRPMNVHFVKELLDKAMPAVYRKLVVELRNNKRDHGRTQRQPGIWDIPEFMINAIYMKEYRGFTQNMLGVRAKPDGAKQRANGARPTAT